MHSSGLPPLFARLRPAHWLVFDYVVAGAYAVPTSLLLVNLAGGTAGALAVPLGILAFTAPVAVRRRHPVLALCTLLAALALVGLIDPRALPLGLLPLAYVLYTAAAVTRPTTAFLSLAASLGAAVATALPDFRQRGAAFLFVVLYIAVWALGYAVGMHRRYTADLLDYQARLAEAELQEARQKVTRERIRIARELHDMVAHGMSVITVQAGYGNLVLDDEPAAARAALSAIGTTGRQTLTEMRSLLTVLRHDDPGDSPGRLTVTPTPGMAEIDGLLEQTAKAGVRAELTFTGTRRPLPAGIDLAAYRIVQEALTNVVKHADTTAAAVRFDFHDDELTIAVTDEGKGGPQLPKPGHGIVGISERVHLYGGSMHARPRRSGRGFEVLCRIPLTGSARKDTSSVTAATPA